MALTGCLAEVGIEPSVGSVGGSCDDAFVEVINGVCELGSSN